MKRFEYQSSTLNIAQELHENCPDDLIVQLDDQRAQLGRILGLDSAVPDQVFEAAVENSTYATNLLVCRRQPELLDLLLSKPPKRRANAEIPTAELVRKGVEALWKWGRAGFSVVDETVLQRRLAACEACPHLSAPPDGQRLLYALAGAMGEHKPVCQLCGCIVTRKARLGSEACPDPHPATPEMSRWGEPFGQAEPSA